MSNSNSSKVVVGLLAGIAIGAIAGILLAPEKGSVTRAKISKDAEAELCNLKDKFTDLVETLTEKVKFAKLKFGKKEAGSEEVHETEAALS